MKNNNHNFDLSDCRISVCIYEKSFLFLLVALLFGGMVGVNHAIIPKYQLTFYEKVILIIELLICMNSKKLGINH